MPLSIFLFAFCVLIGWLALRYARPKAKTKREHRRLALVFGVLAILLALNAALGWVGRRSLTAALEAEPIESAEGLLRAKVDEEVLVVGTLPLDAKDDSGEPGAHFECRPYCQYRGPRPLPLLVDGSLVWVANEDYERREWRYKERSDEDYSHFLEPDASLVVVGRVAKTSGAAPARGQAAMEVSALVVFAGSYDAFASRAERRLIIPTALLALSAVGALLALALAATSLLARGEEG